MTAPGACAVCGVAPLTRVLDDPGDLIPAGQRLAALVTNYVASGEGIKMLAAMPLEQAAAVLLMTELLRAACPPHTEFGMWVGAFLLAWEMRA